MKTNHRLNATQLSLYIRISRVRITCLHGVSFRFKAVFYTNARIPCYPRISLIFCYIYSHVEKGKYQEFTRKTIEIYITLTLTQVNSCQTSPVLRISCIFFHLLSAAKIASLYIGITVIVKVDCYVGLVHVGCSLCLAEFRFCLGVYSPIPPTTCP